jgi:hypothetical protein
MEYKYFEYPIEYYLFYNSRQPNNPSDWFTTEWDCIQDYLNSSKPVHNNPIIFCKTQLDVDW